ncbi:MAG: hypothetical protein HN348_05650, partial [Proteobacteria bacterium]|nr:hypothetical protein [Pseudomonadota bacterium]
MGWIIAVLGVLASSVALAGEAEDVALEALALDFRQDGLAIPSDLSQLYQSACSKGYKPVCQAKNWRGDRGGDLKKASQVFSVACSPDDAVACLVTGWSRTQVIPGIPDNRASAPADGAGLVKMSCDLGLSRGCWELSRLQLKGVG